MISVEWASKKRNRDKHVEIKLKKYAFIYPLNREEKSAETDKENILVILFKLYFIILKIRKPFRTGIVFGNDKSICLWTQL